MRVATLGDLLLDVVVRLDEPLVPGDDRPATTRAGAGGQAANVAAWVAVLGGSARFIGKRGGDGTGELVEAELRAPGWFDCDVLHVSGYSLQLEPIASAAERAVKLARASGARVSVDLSTWSSIDDAFRARVRSLTPDVVFAGERERDTFGAMETDWIVKRGALGVVIDG